VLESAYRDLPGFSDHEEPDSVPFLHLVRRDLTTST